MIRSIDLTRLRSNSSDIADLRAVLQQLVGQPFLALRISYGDELQVHLGEPRTPRRHRSGKVVGSYIIGTRASAWTFRSGTRAWRMATRTDARGAIADIRTIERADRVSPGATVTHLMVPDATDRITLALTWSDQSTVDVLSSVPESMTKDEDDPPLADWEIFTPNQRLVTVGPGRVWALLDSGRG